MGAKVGIDDGARGRPADIQFEDEATETVGFIPVTTRFLNRFTGHALGRSTYRDSSFSRKLFWLLVFLTISGYMSYGIIEIVNAYTSGLTTTATQMEPREMIPFPAIIICPQNFFERYGVMPFDVSGLFSPMESLLQKKELNQGLRLALAPYFLEKLGGFSSAMGHKLFVRNPQDVPYTIEEGFNINPGTVSYVGLKMVEFERISPDRGGNCATDSYILQRFDPKIYKVPNETVYSVEECLKFCVASQLMLDSKLSRCMNRSYYEEIVYEVPKGKCYLDGSSRQFAHEVGGLDEEDYKENRGITKLDLLPSEQISVVHVKFDTMSVEKTTEIQLYPWSSFIGTLGGLLGLYTGMSFISVLEMLEWIVDIFSYGWRKPRPDTLVPKRRAFLVWRDVGPEEVSREKFIPKGEYLLGDPPVYNCPSFKEIQRAALDSAFSDRL
ncbi:unnamed protein product [Darwinula stevensoni]|uniref:Uncharacterized protein n=1 Tax=Darwinula stevensoni TaxID=69355 RepID=A0A7R9ACR3_9CRUS|nr:unnamed protein product [Darwinula stevensoni]CAG0900260.1 unnamed protein product [Darwinula stevensoni]